MVAVDTISMPESVLTPLIEAAIRMDKLHELGVDNWNGYDECHPTHIEIQRELDFYKKAGNR